MNESGERDFKCGVDRIVERDEIGRTRGSIRAAIGGVCAPEFREKHTEIFYTPPQIYESSEIFYIYKYTENLLPCSFHFLYFTFF